MTDNFTKELHFYPMKSPRSGKEVPNQIEIDTRDYIYFQSYQHMIARKDKATGEVTLSRIYWDYSRTTGKYRNIFLGETMRETQKKIYSGEYEVVDTL